MGAIVGVIVGDSRTMEVSFLEVTKWPTLLNLTQKSKMTKVKSSDVDSVMFQFGKTQEPRAILRS